MYISNFILCFNKPYSIVSQAYAGRVFDAVRVLASGIQMAIDKGLPLNNHLPAQDFCNATVDKRSEDRGKRLRHFLRKVRKTKSHCGDKS